MNLGQKGRKIKFSSFMFQTFFSHSDEEIYSSKKSMILVAFLIKENGKIQRPACFLVKLPASQEPKPAVGGSIFEFGRI